MSNPEAGRIPSLKLPYFLGVTDRVLEPPKYLFDKHFIKWSVREPHANITKSGFKCPIWVARSLNETDAISEVRFQSGAVGSFGHNPMQINLHTLLP
jgi:hypothetical protein